MNDIVSKAHHLSLASENDITKHRMELFFNHSDFLPHVLHNLSPILPSQTAANTKQVLSGFSTLLDRSSSVQT